LGLISGLSKEAIHSQLKTALNYAIHIEKDSQGKRKVVGIGEFKVDEKGYLYVEEIIL
jgi:Flp pilus assembly CpaF family ATPase